MADSSLIDIQSSGEEGVASSTADVQLIGIEGPEIEEFKSAPEEAGGGGGTGKRGGGGAGKGGGGKGAGSTMEKEGGGEKEKKKKPKCTIKWPWSKRNSPSLDKVEEGSEHVAAAGADEVGQAKGAAAQSPLERCPDYFGVRSYLHHFYESRAAFKDPDVYEEADDTRHLLNTSSRRQRHCTAAWWKGFVFIGVLFLVVGIVCVLVGYLLPQKPFIVGMVGSDKEVIDRQAIIYNYNLDACKLIGLILFCLGGLTLAVALMIPSFLYRHCDDDRSEGSFAAPLGRDEAPPLFSKDPLLMAVPSTEKVTEVQPARKHDESALIREGTASYPGLE